MLKKTLDFVDWLINAVMIVFFLLLILIGGYAFFDSYQIYDSVKLDAEIINLKPKKQEDSTIGELLEINPDAEAWITMFETTIDYPIVHSKDNLDYLNLDYKRNYTTGGSIFSDYRNTLGFKDDYTIVYGHNMATGQMFSDIKKYEDARYFDQHSYGVLYTADNVYKLEALYVAKVNAFEDDIYNLITYANGRNKALAELVRGKSIRGGVTEEVGKLILLSTCDSYGSNDRTVLLVRATSSSDDEIETIEDSVAENIGAGDSEGTAGGSGFWAGFKDLWWIILIVILVVIAIKIIERKLRRRANKKPEKSLDKKRKLV